MLDELAAPAEIIPDATCWHVVTEIAVDDLSIRMLVLGGAARKFSPVRLAADTLLQSAHWTESPADVNIASICLTAHTESRRPGARRMEITGTQVPAPTVALNVARLEYKLRGAFDPPSEITVEQICVRFDVAGAAAFSVWISYLIGRQAVVMYAVLNKLA